jgi:predicted enzyme related to lactoylglutathione lyase
MKKVESQVNPKVELWMCETEDENGPKGITVDMMKRDSLLTVTNYILDNSIDEYISKITKSGGCLCINHQELIRNG